MRDGDQGEIYRTAESSAWEISRHPLFRPPALQPDVRTETPVVVRRRGAVAAAGAVSARLAAAAHRSRDAVAQEREYGHFFLFVPVFLGAGAAIWYALPRDPPMLALLIACAVFAWPAWRRRHDPDLIAVAAAAAFLLPVGMVFAALESNRLSTVILDTPVTTHIEGRVLSREADDRGRIRYLVQLTSTRDPALKRPPSRITLLVRSAHEPVSIGGTIAGRARLNPPSGPALPGLNDFAFDAYMAGNGAVGFFYGKPDTSRPSSSGGGIFERMSERIATWRNGITEHIRSRIGGDAGAIAAALVTAEQRAISPDTVEALRQAGLAHVLAISGLNMVLAAGTFLVGARMFLALVPGLAERYPVKKIAAAGALVMVTLYIMISGGAISAVRSWIMISIMLIAVFFDRTAISLRNIALSGILILIVTPSAVTGPGFQMSFAATLGLVAGYAAWRERPVRQERPNLPLTRYAGFVSRFLGGLLLSSLIGGFATLIYSIGHFHRIPAYGLAGNLVAMPVISAVVMPFGLIAMLLMPFGLDALPFAIMGKGIDWMIAISHWVAGWGGEVVTGRIPQASFLLIGLGGGLLCLLRTRLRLSGLLLVLVGTFLAFWPDARPPPELLVSEDGRLVAILSGGEAATNRGRPPDFIYSQWRRALRIQSHTPPQLRPAGQGKANEKAVGDVTVAEKRRKERRRNIDSESARRQMAEALEETEGKPRFICRAKEWCAARTPSNWRVVTIEDPAFLGAACDSADFVVASQHLRSAHCRSGGLLLTARTLRTTGALEISPAAEPSEIGPSYAITASVDTLRRPWTLHRSYDWRSGSFQLDGEAVAINDNGE
ncbi:MAG: ComEC/Rec2 family competence protein [Shinella sp.]|nr:ComEC/Rec2 family competence protein [Shinella sp.]